MGVCSRAVVTTSTVTVDPFNRWATGSVQEGVRDVWVITLGGMVRVGRWLLPLCLPLGISCWKLP